MTSRQRLLVLIAVMAMVGFTAVGFSLWTLYKTVFEEERGRLMEIVQSHARLIEAVARFDATHSQDANPAGAAAATLDQIIDAHRRYQGFGETGEFILAKREKEEIIFLLSFRDKNPKLQRRLPMHGLLAEPMQRALNGKSGTMIGLDYRGVRVLASYEPVAVLDVGIVAKIDLAEIQMPFIRACALSLGGGVVIFFLGTELFFYFGQPLVERLELRVMERTLELTALNVKLTREVAERKQVQEALSHSLFDQEIIASILQLAQQPLPLVEILRQSLTLVLERHEVNLCSKGVVFLVDKEAKELEMVVQQGLPESIIESCGLLPFGHCLCGMAAKEGKVIFSDRVDDRHMNSYEGMEPHGHYCVPIQDKDELYGVFTVYVPEGHQWIGAEEQFIITIADTLAGVIRRRRSEEKLSESEKSLSEAQRIAQLGNWSLDLVTNTMRCSNEVYRIFGLEPGQVSNTYETFFDAIHTDDRDYVNTAYTESVKNRLPYDITHRIQLGDGTIKYVNERCETFYAEDGTPLRSIGTIQDITDQRRAEEKLHQAATMFDNTTEGIFIADSEVKIVAANRALSDITGYSEIELLGCTPKIWKSDRHDRLFYQAMWASLEQSGQWRGEIWNRRMNGEAFPCWQTITAVKDDFGNILQYISVLSDITAVKESQAQLEHLAHHDPLTNLPNRLLFNARLRHALERASREKNGIGVMFLDLDNFKPINDGLGHPVGDKVLQTVAKRLTDMVRQDDTVARLGGDEFAIILEDAGDLQGVSHVARKILYAFESPFKVAGQELYITTTIGISLYPKNGKDVTTLVKNADAAMFRAKEQGKNRYCFYTKDLTEAALERLQLENDLRIALKRNEFSVYYQPQYSLDTKQLVGAEALVRWQHPEKGLISPIKFIPLAESTGLIITLGEWVLREACAQIKSWQEAGCAMERIGVNVAGPQIQRSNFVITVQRVLEETGLDPKCLELEITESFIMQQADKAIKTLEELRGLGVTLAIDDFGTGYSSLSYLKRLPINKLKIDQSFVKDIPQNLDDKAIAKAVIALSRSLNLEVIAEGVETEEQEAFLRTEGCDEVQGYYYSRPVQAKDFLGMLKPG